MLLFKLVTLKKNDEMILLLHKVAPMTSREKFAIISRSQIKLGSIIWPAEVMTGNVTNSDVENENQENEEKEEINISYEQLLNSGIDNSIADANLELIAIFEAHKQIAMALELMFGQKQIFSNDRMFFQGFMMGAGIMRFMDSSHEQADLAAIKKDMENGELRDMLNNLGIESKEIDRVAGTGVESEKSKSDFRLAYDGLALDIKNKAGVSILESEQFINSQLMQNHKIDVTSLMSPNSNLSPLREIQERINGESAEMLEATIAASKTNAVSHASVDDVAAHNQRGARPIETPGMESQNSPIKNK